VESESPLNRLSPEDLAMICTFVLHSGSVKALSETYGVSYPTMRARLDALIERLRQAMAGRQPDPLNEYLADLIAKGRIAAADAHKIRELHRLSVAAAESRSSRTQEISSQNMPLQENQ
jgi:hypothetical protein